MKQLIFEPVIDACDLPCEIADELACYEISTHYSPDYVSIWDCENDKYPAFKKWLLETYGEEVKNIKCSG
jgi:hypothetical protein